MDLVVWSEKCLTCQAQRIVISDMTSTWRFVLNGVPQRMILGPVPLTTSLTTECTFGRFVDYMKPGAVADPLQSYVVIRRTAVVCRNKLTETP